MIDQNPPHEKKTPVSQFSEHRGSAFVIAGIAIMLALFTIRPMYATHTQRSTDRIALENQIESLSKEYNSLKNMSESIKNGNIASEVKAKIEKIKNPIKLNELYKTTMLNPLTIAEGINEPAITVSSVSIGEKQKLPNGLSLTSVSISVRGKTQSDIIQYITYLTKDTPYLFALDNISLPLDTRPDGEIEWASSLSFSLGAYSYEE